MANNFEIPFQPPDLSSGIATLMTALKGRREEKHAEQQLEINKQKIANDERRLNAEAYRRNKEFEQGQEDRRNKAFLSALEFEKRGDTSTADAIRRMHGIQTTPEMSAPSVFTPAQALAAAKPEAPTGNPVTLEPSVAGASAVTPMNAFRRETQVGTTVPEEQPQPPAVAPPSVTQEQPQTGRAVEDLLPMAEDAHPTGAKTFTGPNGEPLGRFDPEEEKRFRADRAGRLAETFGSMGPRYVSVLDAISRGDVSEKEGMGLLTTLAMVDKQAEMERQKNAELDRKQAFTQAENEKYRSEGLSFEQRMKLAEAVGGSRIAAAGAVTSPSDMANLATLMNVFKETGDNAAVIAENAKLKKPINTKALEPALKQIVGQETASERAGQKREQLNGIDNAGNKIVWNSPQAATKGTQQVQRFNRVEVRLKELIDDVEKHGERIAPDSKEYVRRMSAAEAAAAALRPYNELSSTDASMAAERAILGPMGAFGHGWMLGADLPTLKKILHEAQQQQAVNIRTLSRPGGGSQLSPVLGGKRGEGGSPSGGGHWIPIPARLAGEPEAKGHREMLVDSAGKFLGEFR